MFHCEYGKHNITSEKQRPIWTVVALGVGCRCPGHTLSCCTECYLRYGKDRDLEIIDAETGTQEKQSVQSAEQTEQKERAATQG